MTSARVLVASNRGPVSFRFTSTAPDGPEVSCQRGGGGLVSAMSGIAADAATVWVCAALSDADRFAARSAPAGRIDRAGHDTGGLAVRMLDIDRGIFERAYNGVANSTLWFLAHLLFDTARLPSFGPAFRREWQAYRSYCAAFADALASEAGSGATVIVQDYHLALTPRMLRDRRPDLRIGHVTHTPWAPPEYFRMLPAEVAAELLDGMLGADRLTFLDRRWADAFHACCVARLGRAGTGADARAIVHTGRTTRMDVQPLGVDPGGLRARARGTDVQSRAASLREWAGDRQLILRVDRAELSKNIVRGLEAYRELLRAYPGWRGRVVHLALCYLSRRDLPEYREYTAAVQRLATEIDDEFGTEDWQPLRLEMDDDWPRSLAAYGLADVLLVNPIRDGMNLVAKEGPVLSEAGLALVLSTEAGAASELAAAALLVNPFDVTATAAALDSALAMPAAERSERCARLAAAAGALPPQKWFARMLQALSETAPPEAAEGGVSCRSASPATGRT